MKHKERYGRSQRQRRRLPVQEEQDRRLHRPRHDRGARQGRGDGAQTARSRRSRPRPSSSRRARMWRGFPASTSMRRTSSLRPVRSNLPKCQAKLLVVGAGVIGLELGSVWRRLGADVTVVEFLDRILPGIDGEVAKQFQRMLEKQGLKFAVGQRSRRSTSQQNGLKVRSSRPPAARAETIEADVVLGGHRSACPYTEGLGLEAAGVTKDKRGRVIVDRAFRHQCPRHLRDRRCRCAGPMLAHKAEDEGIAAAEIHCRPGRPCELRRDPERRLHHPGNRLGRRDRGRAEGQAASPTRSANFRSAPMAAPAPSSRPKASSKFSPTPRPIACSACTFSGPMPRP